MLRSTPPGLILVLTFALAACGTPPGNGGTDGGTDGGTAAGDGGTDGGTSAWTCKPDPTLSPGAPITAPDETWTWVDFPGTRCMDGSATGLGVNLNPASDKVIIFLEGGGACFDPYTCGSVANPNGYGKTRFDAQSGGLTTGIFNRTNPDNPVKDWSYVYIPYCSGDVYAGNTTNGYGGRTQVGFANIHQYLQRLVPTFEQDKLVVLAGSSAGGFGAAWNYDQTQTAFGCTPVDLIDDSGPPMSDQYLKPCLQQQWRSIWNLDATLPKDCAACTEPNGGGLVNLAPYLAKKFPGRRLSLLSHTHDGTIRLFFSYGYSPQCNYPDAMPAADFEAGLTDLRDNVLAGAPNFKMYLQSGTSHTFLHGSLTTQAVGSTSLGAWLGQELGDDPSWDNLGP